MIDTVRRIRQLGYLMLGKSFRDPLTAAALRAPRYETNIEVEHYAALDTLFPEERAVVRRFLASRSHPGRALVVGCGAGREVRALVDSFGFDCTGLDSSEGMIRAARANSPRAEFVRADFETFACAQPFDFIFVSSAIVEHIPGEKKRVAFYQKIFECLAPGGGVYLSPEIRKLKTLSRFGVASSILKWRWGERWEPGDSAKSFFGRHNESALPLYYHFYPDVEAFARELEQAQLSIVSWHEGACLCSGRNNAGGT